MAALVQHGSLPLLVLGGLLLGVSSFRKKSRSSVAVQDETGVGDSPQDTVKYIRGVPILNYHLAYSQQKPWKQTGDTALSMSQATNTSEASVDWLLVVKKGTRNHNLEQLCKASGKAASCVAAGHPSDGGVPFLQMTGTETDLLGVLEQDTDGKVEFVEPDTVVSLPDLELSQGGAGALLLEKESEGHSQSWWGSTDAKWGLNDIDATARKYTGKGTHIYVMDTGVRASHHDFGGRVLPTLDATTDGSSIECSKSYCGQDVQGHGTHCAGIAAGKSYGMAIDARIHTAKVLSNSGSGQWSWILKALDWVATSGSKPAVATMSLAGEGKLSSTKTGIDAAVAAGVTVVVAAGNANADACSYSPGYVRSAITVGSITSSESKSSFSNYGACVDIWAPGSKITSDSNKDDTSTRVLSGTSMACPFVAGTAALALEGDSTLTSEAILAQLVASAKKDAITGLNKDDHNTLLHVSSGAQAHGRATTTVTTLLALSAAVAALGVAGGAF